jgi:hypothetical protein
LSARVVMSGDHPKPSVLALAIAGPTARPP